MRESTIRRVAAAALLGALLGPVTVPAQTVHPKGTTIWKLLQAQWGRTFFVSPDGTGRLVSMGGRLINTWGGGTLRFTDIEPIPDNRGDVLALRGSINVPGYPRPRADEMVQLDRDGNVFNVWTTPTLSRGTFGGFHHDMVRLPNGNTLVLCSVLVTDPAVSPRELIDDCIVELDFDNNIVWEWYTFEHYDQLALSAGERAAIADAGGDWAHANSIEVIPPNDHTDPAFAPGNIIISYRGLSVVAIIDRATGDIVWQLGPDFTPMIGQHAPYMIEQGFPGAGNILLFSNGLEAGYDPPRSAAFSRVLEVDPVTKRVAWQYNATFSGAQPWMMFSPIISNAQRLLNGNTLITEGTKGRLFEVTDTGEIVWEYMVPFFGTAPGPNGIEVKNFGVYRSYRMPFWWGSPSPPAAP